jgi:nicotinamide riboside transporter PnuC
MDSYSIEQLLETYFEGKTTLEQEQQLRQYFTGEKVVPHLESYVGMFTAFAKAQQETTTAPISLPSKKASYSWIAGIAVAVVLTLVLITQRGSKERYSSTYQNQEVAVLKTKQTLGMVKKMIEQSTAQLVAVKEFENTTNQFFKQ